MKKHKPTIKFIDVEQQIKDRLNSIQKNIGEPVSLVDGFIRPQHTMELSDNPVVFGYSTLPMITLVGDSGRLYFFALKSLLPDLEI